MSPATGRTRIALVVMGVLYAWTAFGNYQHLRPWRDGSMFASEPTGELGQMIDLAYYLIVFTIVASVSSFVLAAVAGIKPLAAICAALVIFVVYTALRLYQTEGRCLSDSLWWLTAISLGVAVQAAVQTNQLRRGVPTRSN